MRQGRTDAWIAHQLEVSASDIRAFKQDHGLAPTEADGDDGGAAFEDDELDLRAEDDALVAAALEAEQEADPTEEASSSEEETEEGEPQARRRRGRRGGRRRRRKRGLEGTFDHGEEGYGLWLDPAVQDDPVYAEHWAGHRPVEVLVEAERIVITRVGDDGDGEDEDEES